MEILVPPNLNGKVYRDFIPAQEMINNFLDFIDVENGNVLLGSSNLNGRYWTGSICLYKDFKEDSDFDVENAFLYDLLDTGVTDGKFIPNKNKIVISQDSGTVRLYDIDEDKLILMNQQTLEEHDEAITEISLWRNTDTFLTSSTDTGIKMWQIMPDGLYCVNSYNYVHANVVSSINAHPTDTNLFVTASYDKTALFWDIREDINTTVIYEREFCALTKIQWHNTNSNIVAIGTSAGDIYMVDIRHPREFVSKNDTFSKSIHNMSFNARDLLAVCADNSEVSVMDVAEDLQTIYSDDRHKHFVRGLVWRDNVLLSCGWDKKVLLHFV